MSFKPGDRVLCTRTWRSSDPARRLVDYGQQGEFYTVSKVHIDGALLMLKELGGAPETGGPGWLRADRFKSAADIANPQQNDETKRLGRERDEAQAFVRLFIEALAEIKATVDGKSDQPVKDIVYRLIEEVPELRKRFTTGEGVKTWALYDVHDSGSTFSSEISETLIGYFETKEEVLAELKRRGFSRWREYDNRYTLDGRQPIASWMTYRQPKLRFS